MSLLRVLSSLAVLMIAGTAAAADVRAPFKVTIIARLTFAEVRVVDGDTLALNGVRIRLWGIDAPEMDNEAGELAQSTLAVMLTAAGELRCYPQDEDRYGRAVMICLDADGRDIAERMVSEGLARDWPEYSKGHYELTEAAARLLHRGFWSCSPKTVPGWEAKKREVCPAP